MAAGLSSELLRPMNSLRSQVALNILSFVAANATRSANSLLKGFFAKIVEAADGGWQAEVKGRLNGAGDEIAAKSVLLIEPSYGGY